MVISVRYDFHWNIGKELGSTYSTVNKPLMERAMKTVTTGLSNLPIDGASIDVTCFNKRIKMVRIW